MRLIDADELKEKLLKMQSDIANEREPRGNTKSDTWKAAYLLVFDEYIKMLDEMSSKMHVCDDFHETYCRGYLKGREDILKEQQQMKDYCKNDCDAIYESYTRGYSEGYIGGISNTLKGMQKKKKDE